MQDVMDAAAAIKSALVHVSNSRSGAGEEVVSSSPPPCHEIAYC